MGAPPFAARQRPFASQNQETMRSKGAYWGVYLHSLGRLSVKPYRPEVVERYVQTG
jgi:hypothetical protein